MSKKLSAKSMAARLSKKLGKAGTIDLMGDGAGIRDVFPTGLEVLDRWVFGVGGCPWGRVIEISGDFGSGKTTLATKLMAGAQRAGHIAAIVDAEFTFDPAWARLHGVDTSQLLHFTAKPMYLDGEGGALHFVQEACKLAKEEGQRALVVVDSVPALKSKREAEEGLTADEGVAELSRHWSRGLRVFTEDIAESMSTLVVINQLRSNIGAWMGPPSKPTGGKAISFYSSVRIKTWRASQLIDGGNATKVGVQATKSKIAVPMRQCELKLNFETGFVERWNILNHAKDRSVVSKKCQSLKEALTGLGWVDLLGASEAEDVEVEQDEEGQQAADE